MDSKIMSEEMANSNNDIRAETVLDPLGAFLKNHHEIEVLLPTIAGMFATNKFKARGATALLINLIAVTMTREMIEYLKKPSPNRSITEFNGNASVASVPQFTTDGSTIYYVLHTIPGRIRLQIPRLISDKDYAKRLHNLMVADENVINVRANYAAGSLAINYQATGLSDWELGLRLMNIMNLADSSEPVSEQGVSFE
jgi:Heavy metal associated domain 2